MSNVQPLKTTRAVREPGKRMRSRLLDAAVVLFKDQGLAGVAVADIAAAAGAFPSQITYYFRTKEALFVEAACREVLYVARQAEEAAAGAASGLHYNRVLVETVVGSPGLALFVDDPAVTARRFWTLALGVALRDGATGATTQEAIDEMLALMRHSANGGHD